MSDRIVSLIRTWVPIAWGWILAQILPHLPWLPESVVTWLSGAAGQAAVVALVSAAWYALWRWLEPRIPDWLTRLVLGSAQAPTYTGGDPTA